MFKSFLNEYCQSKAWILPDYRIKREGPDHRTRWKGLVVVNGKTFVTPYFCKSSKEAQDVAAKLAFEHFCDMRHMYKLQLQIYAQKRNLKPPVYSFNRVGPFHSCRFKSRVKIAGKTYESGAFFYTLKEAENAAAKAALASVFSEATQQDDPTIYKNLLQESLQKEHSCLPTYTTVHVGQPNIPLFLSTVVIQGETFRGQEAKTKKQAEMNAAKVAYIALTERKFKKDDEQNAVGATAHIRETPKSSSASIPVVGATTWSKNVRSDAKPMSEKQISSVEDIGLEATPSVLTRTRGAAATCGSIRSLKATSSVPEPTYYQKNHSSSTLKSQPVRGSGSYNQKMKTKITTLPQSVSSSFEDVKPVINKQKDLNIPPQGREKCISLPLIPNEEMDCSHSQGPQHFVKPVIHNQKDDNIPPQGTEKWIALIPKEEMDCSHSQGPQHLGQLVTSPDASVCTFHSREKWNALIPKEETVTPPDASVCKLHSTEKWIALIPKEET